MKLILRMKRKMICLTIAQTTMASQIIWVILIQHPQKDHFLRNLKNRRKMKRWTKRCKCYGKAIIRSRRILLIYLVSPLQMKSDHWRMQMLNVGWSLKYKKLFFKSNSTLTFRPIQIWLVLQHHKEHHRTLAILPFLIRSNLSRIIHHWEKDKCMNHHNPRIVCWVLDLPQTWKWQSDNNEQSTTFVYMCISLKIKPCTSHSHFINVWTQQLHNCQAFSWSIFFKKELDSDAKNLDSSVWENYVDWRF